MSNLMQASHEWATRPEDQRFETLDAMYDATRVYADATVEKPGYYKDLKAIDHPEYGLALIGQSGKPATFTNFSFGQFCQRIGAPASYLRTLPTPLAVHNLQYGLDRLASEVKDPQQFLIHTNGKNTIRAVTSNRYERVWNYDLVDICRQLPTGWVVPPARPAFSGQKGTRPATESDLLRMRESGLSIKLGDSIAPAGLYASDHDSFIFMVNENACIDAGPQERMARGFFLKNSEVGDAYLTLTMFYYSYVCGNHIVWGANKVTEVKVKHVGRRARNFENVLRNAVYKLSTTSAVDDAMRVRDAKTYAIGDSREKVIDFVFSTKGWVPKAKAELAYDTAVKYSDVHGDPRTAWGFSAGLTRVSQATQFADERETLDRAARKVLEMAF